MNLTGRPISPKLEREIPGLRDSARGQDCTLRIPGLCRKTTDTVVGCHVRAFGMAGAGQKPHDFHIIDACDRCHSVLDNRARWAAAQVGWEDVLRAMMETQQRRFAQGWRITK